MSGRRYPLWYGAALVIGCLSTLQIVRNGHLFGYGVVCGAAGEMEPTFRPGECVLTGPTSSRLLWRGDIVLLQSRRPVADKTHPYLTRVIALPGERVTLKDGNLALTPYHAARKMTVMANVDATTETAEGLPPDHAISPLVQSNSVQKREAWRGDVSYPVFFLDGGERWRRHAVDAELGADAFLVAGDNRDAVRPSIIGFSAISRKPILIVWSSDKERLLTLPR